MLLISIHNNSYGDGPAHCTGLRHKFQRLMTIFLVVFFVVNTKAVKYEEHLMKFGRLNFTEALLKAFELLHTLIDLTGAKFPQITHILRGLENLTY